MGNNSDEYHYVAYGQNINHAAENLSLLLKYYGHCSVRRVNNNGKSRYFVWHGSEQINNVFKCYVPRYEL